MLTREYSADKGSHYRDWHRRLADRMLETGTSQDRFSSDKHLRSAPEILRRTERRLRLRTRLATGKGRFYSQGFCVDHLKTIADNT